MKVTQIRGCIYLIVIDLQIYSPHFMSRYEAGPEQHMMKLKLSVVYQNPGQRLLLHPYFYRQRT